MDFDVQKSAFSSASPEVTLLPDPTVNSITYGTNQLVIDVNHIYNSNIVTMGYFIQLSWTDGSSAAQTADIAINKNDIGSDSDNIVIGRDHAALSGVVMYQTDIDVSIASMGGTDSYSDAVVNANVFVLVHTARAVNVVVSREQTVYSITSEQPENEYSSVTDGVILELCPTGVSSGDGQCSSLNLIDAGVSYVMDTSIGDGKTHYVITNTNALPNRVTSGFNVFVKGMTTAATVNPSYSENGISYLWEPVQLEVKQEQYNLLICFLHDFSDTDLSDGSTGYQLTIETPPSPPTGPYVDQFFTGGDAPLVDGKRCLSVAYTVFPADWTTDSIVIAMVPKKLGVVESEATVDFQRVSDVLSLSGSVDPDTNSFLLEFDSGLSSAFEVPENDVSFKICNSDVMAYCTDVISLRGYGYITSGIGYATVPRSVFNTVEYAETMTIIASLVIGDNIGRLQTTGQVTVLEAVTNLSFTYVDDSIAFSFDHAWTNEFFTTHTDRSFGVWCDIVTPTMITSVSSIEDTGPKFNVTRSQFLSCPDVGTESAIQLFVTPMADSASTESFTPENLVLDAPVVMDSSIEFTTEGAVIPFTHSSFTQYETIPAQGSIIIKINGTIEYVFEAIDVSQWSVFSGGDAFTVTLSLNGGSTNLNEMFATMNAGTISAQIVFDLQTSPFSFASPSVVLLPDPIVNSLAFAGDSLTVNATHAFNSNSITNVGYELKLTWEDALAVDQTVLVTIPGTDVDGSSGFDVFTIFRSHTDLAGVTFHQGMFSAELTATMNTSASSFAYDTFSLVYSAIVEDVIVSSTSTIFEVATKQPHSEYDSNYDAIQVELCPQTSNSGGVGCYELGLTDSNVTFSIDTSYADNLTHYYVTSTDDLPAEFDLTFKVFTQALTTNAGPYYSLDSGAYVWSEVVPEVRQLESGLEICVDHDFNSTDLLHDETGYHVKIEKSIDTGVVYLDQFYSTAAMDADFRCVNVPYTTFPSDWAVENIITVTPKEVGVLESEGATTFTRVIDPTSITGVVATDVDAFEVTVNAGVDPTMFDDGVSDIFVQICSSDGTSICSESVSIRTIGSIVSGFGTVTIPRSSFIDVSWEVTLMVKSSLKIGENYGRMVTSGIVDVLVPVTDASATYSENMVLIDFTHVWTNAFLSSMGSGRSYQIECNANEYVGEVTILENESGGPKFSLGFNKLANCGVSTSTADINLFIIPDVDGIYLTGITPVVLSVNTPVIIESAIEFSDNGLTIPFTHDSYANYDALPSTLGSAITFKFVDMNEVIVLESDTPCSIEDWGLHDTEAAYTCTIGFSGSGSVNLNTLFLESFTSTTIETALIFNHQRSLHSTKTSEVNLLPEPTFGVVEYSSDYLSMSIAHPYNGDNVNNVGFNVEFSWTNSTGGIEKSSTVVTTTNLSVGSDEVIFNWTDVVLSPFRNVFEGELTITAEATYASVMSESVIGVLNYVPPVTTLAIQQLNRHEINVSFSHSRTLNDLNTNSNMLFTIYYAEENIGIIGMEDVSSGFEENPDTDVLSFTVTLPTDLQTRNSTSLLIGLSAKDSSVDVESTIFATVVQLLPIVNLSEIVFTSSNVVFTASSEWMSTITADSDMGVQLILCSEDTSVCETINTFTSKLVPTSGDAFSITIPESSLPSDLAGTITTSVRPYSTLNTDFVAVEIPGQIFKACADVPFTSDVAHTRVVDYAGETKFIGDDIIYHCADGFIPDRESDASFRRTCEIDGDSWSWSGDEPVCVDPSTIGSCDALTPFSTNQKMYGPYSSPKVGNKVIVVCKSGYNITRDLMRCTSNGWSISQPSCAELATCEAGSAPNHNGGCTICWRGYYSSDGTECLKCPIGYSSDIGATACVKD
eukprot:TRINITY_DN471_c0_g1_i3.p1 TRINITY_DN471_c0_g1~~TRINITY_DN471_c0_g1_i3.p1  ORF type:complete len:1853 (-),score=597.53 TRINITY_DN471_c0_g1_i3:728-6286(-)